MFGISLDQLPASLQILVKDAAVRDQAKHEVRRAVLAKELVAERAAAKKESATLAAALDRARTEKEKAWTAYQAAVGAEQRALATRDGASAGRDSVINRKLCELRELVDPRITEFRRELFTMHDKLSNFRTDFQPLTREAGSQASRSNNMVEVRTGAFANERGLKCRVNAIIAALESVDALYETADVDVAKAVDSIRKSIPDIGENEWIRFEDGALPSAAAGAALLASDDEHAPPQWGAPSPMIDPGIAIRP